MSRWLSPAGEIIIGSVGDALCISDWLHNPRRGSIDRRICRAIGDSFMEGSSPLTERTISELKEYFAGERREFDIPLRFVGTEFQCRVWSSLMNIPYGATISYLDLAGRTGNPKAVRAVANAVATNPLSILVPCHRVTGTDGSLTGYAGGLAAKHLLLALETKNDHAERQEGSRENVEQEIFDLS